MLRNAGGVLRKGAGVAASVQEIAANKFLKHPARSDSGGIDNSDNEVIKEFRLEKITQCMHVHMCTLANCAIIICTLRA